MPWGLIRTLGLVVPLYRELAEMAYLWEMPRTRWTVALARLLGPLPQTPLDQVLQGCLRPAPAGARLSGQCDTACLTTPEPQVVGVL
jgi:hypothetical protein